MMEDSNRLLHDRTQNRVNGLYSTAAVHIISTIGGKNERKKTQK